MSLETRIGKLEEQTGGKKQFEICIHYIGDKTEPTEAQHETAIADFKAKTLTGKSWIIYLLAGSMVNIKKPLKC